MDNSPASPLFVILLFILRCLVPLIILMGISYLLRKFGLVSEPYKDPQENDGNNQNATGEGVVEHGKT
jgi:hypothetical protein